MGRPPLLSKLQKERENNPEIRTGRAGEGHAGVIWLEQDAEKSNLLWSDSLKATKETNREGSLGSLAACAQYFIINDNNTKEKGGRKGMWGVHPPFQFQPPPQTDPGDPQEAHKGTGSRAPQKHLQEKGIVRQDEEWVSSDSAQLLPKCLSQWGPSAGFRLIY